MKKIVAFALAGLLIAAPAFAEQIMGAPNSGAGRSVTGDNNPSGAGRTQG